MKLEFLADGHSNCPLIRLYDFDLADAKRLREAFRCLASGSRQDLPLHQEWWIDPLEDCALDLRRGPRDLVVVERAPSRFEGVATENSWTQMASLIEPCCQTKMRESCIWLNRSGEISLLLTPSGGW